MRQTPPRAEQLNRFQWFSDDKSGHPVFRLRMPRLSERDGRICCLRVIVVKLRRGQTAADLPHQSELSLSSYRRVHASPDAWGAYIAEILGANFLGKDVLVGDGQNILSAHMGGCPACQTGVRAHLLQAARSAEERRVFRRDSSGGTFVRLRAAVAEALEVGEADRGSFKQRRSAAAVEPAGLVEDGFLDPEANYTAFVELVIPETAAVGRSPYMSPRRPGEAVSVLAGGSGNGTAGAIVVCLVGVLAGLLLVALSLTVALFLLRRYSKKVAATQGGVEMNLRRSFRHLCSTLRGRDHSQYLITPEAPRAAEIAPIAREALVKEYLERHKDSDYGFQAEFEMLPDRYPDRTTETCDAPYNRAKNRYPDIKCYDQVRIY